MLDTELIEIAGDFRDGILGGRPPAMMCAAVAWPLQGFLSAFYGIETEAVETRFAEGGNHIWLRMPDGRVLDPTADQFNGVIPDAELPPVYLGPPLSIHRT
jgi:hypothetical protein